jgi:tryptophan 2,3-dioxygenase
LVFWQVCTTCQILFFTYLCGTLVYVEKKMETRNITLAIPEEVLLKAKLIAVKRQTSVSGLVTQALERLVQQEDVYARARHRHVQWLERGADLGTGGLVSTRREELHERA